MPELKLSTGKTDYYEVDDFTDPWEADTPEIIVWQPGMLRHSDLIFHVVPLLIRDVRLIRRNLRGFGRSSIGDSPGYPYTLDTLVDEIAEFVDKVAGRPVH
jgi:alpha-beta hydrolase superfamily lysophospholipase